MNDVIDELRERAAAVTARPVAPDWPRLRRSRRARRARLTTAATAGVAIVLGTGVVLDRAASPAPAAVLTVTTPPTTEAPAPARSSFAEPDLIELGQLGALTHLTKTDGIYATVIRRGEAVAGYDQTARLDVGSADGVTVGKPVVASGGLIGMVVQVAARTSVVGLIDDRRSDVFVDTVRGDHLTADVMGQGPGQLLLYTQQVPAGQLSSGTGLVTRQGSAYDEGIPVGILGPSYQTDGGTEATAQVAPSGQVDTATVVEVLLAQNENAPRAPIEPQSPPAPAATLGTTPAAPGISPAQTAAQAGPANASTSTP